MGRYKDLRRVAMGFPGGKKGKEDASTTLRPFTPYTLPLLSTTAWGSETFPMDAVQQPWDPGAMFCLSQVSIWASVQAVSTPIPGRTSAPVMFRRDFVLKKLRTA